ncbi:MAG TPA: hypothetical protein VK661_01675 [Planctomycetota bacterium]|nr:hypothetical protein [Planctomycetota bacterium]
MQLNVPRALALYLAWTGLTCGALLVAIGGMLPFGLSSMGPDGIFLCLMEVELFFVTVLWPFFMPRLLRPAVEGAIKTAGPGAESHLLILQVGVLLVVALPLALVTQDLSQITVGQFFRGHLLVGAIACFVTALVGQLGWARTRPWYFLAFFTFSALFPFLGFLSGEVGGGSRLEFLAVLSPFWAAAQLQPGASISWAPGAQAAVFGLLAVALLATGPFLRTRASEPA